MHWPVELSPSPGPAWPLRSLERPLLVLKVGAAGPTASGGVPALAEESCPVTMRWDTWGPPGFTETRPQRLCWDRSPARPPPRNSPAADACPPQTYSRWRSLRPTWPSRWTRSHYSRRTWS